MESMRKSIALLAVSVVLFASCSGKEDPVKLPVDEISVSADTLRFGPEGGKSDLKVNSSSIWRVSGLCDWVTLSALSGDSGSIVSFAAKPNKGGSLKESSFKFFTGSAVKQVVVISYPDDEFSLVSEQELTFASEGGIGYVRVRTNVDDIEYNFSGNGSEWIHQGKMSSAFGYNAYQFDVKNNKLYVNRESVLTLKGNGRSISVKFVQSQRDTVGITNTDMSYDLKARDIEFKIKTNIIPDFKLPDWMTLISVTDGTVDSDGLIEKTIRLHLKESVASRSYTITFTKESKEMLSLIINQKNPNPVIAHISDANLRKRLSDMGWIYTDGTSSECEVLELGLTSSSLTLESDNYYLLDVSIVDGLGTFPKLQELTINNARVQTVNVADCKSLKRVIMSQTEYIDKVLTGSSPVSEVEIKTTAYGSIVASSVMFKGDNIEIIKMNSNSSAIAGWEKLTSVDVTGCPSLASLYAKRAYVDYYGNERCVLASIYVTAAQKAAIDAGTLAVEKSDLTSIEVK